MLKIDTDIPVPAPRRAYPFRSMAVGESCFIEGKRLRDVAGSLAHARRTDGRQFRARHETDAGVPGVRIWRIS